MNKEKLASSIMIFVGFLVMTPIFAGIGILFTGAGHGSYLLAAVLFPTAMISREIIIAVAILQFPVYGAILGFANYRNKLTLAAIILAIFHVLLVLLIFGTVLDFSREWNRLI
jgi:hypothetical protein